MTTVIITEYSIPSAAIYSYSNHLKLAAKPLHNLGDIVIVPDRNGDPIYAVISLICANRDTYPPESWVYGITPESNPMAIDYVPEYLVVSRKMQ
jgi:hypothetical protein